MMADLDDWYEMEDVVILRETQVGMRLDGYLFVEYEREQFTIPKHAVLWDETEISRRGEVGSLIIDRRVAVRKGIADG